MNMYEGYILMCDCGEVQNKCPIDKDELLSCRRNVVIEYKENYFIRIGALGFTNVIWIPSDRKLREMIKDSGACIVHSMLSNRLSLLGDSNETFDELSHDTNLGWDCTLLKQETGGQDGTISISHG